MRSDNKLQEHYISSRQEVTDFASRITDHLKGDGYYNTAPAVSPKGDKVAYISNRDDYFDVFIASVKTGKIIKTRPNITLSILCI